MQKLIKNLGFWILVAMVAGVVAGIVMGERAALFVPLGTLFIQLIKMLVVPLVAISIISGAATLGGSRSAGRIGLVSIGFIMVTTVISIILAIFTGLVFEPGAGLSAESVGAIMANASSAETAKPEMSFWGIVIGMIPANPIQAFAEGNILQIIVFGLFLGFGIAALDAEKRDPVIRGLNYLLEALVWCIGKVMLIAPIGVFGLMAEATGTFGFDVLLKVANLLWVDLLAVAVMGLVVYPLLLATLSRVKVSDFFRAMVRPQVIAFSTASSMATLPVTMGACAKLGISRQTAGFVVPLGATINMTGNAIYYTLVALFFAQFYGIELSIAHYVAITVTASLGSIGQAGVPGPTLMVVAVLVAAGIPIEGLPLLYALDRVFDMIRTVLNITGDAACAAVTDRFAKEA
ncbi:MAG: dicarboxylate/amino acid:cation symporter [Rikenellaceae bacterium]|nr:dicarboxylate/amino acid:cation symporter [Rikenellaceae bacterium]